MRSPLGLHLMRYPFWRRLGLAFSFLTRLPVPRIDGDREEFAAAIRYYPFVGCIVGALVAGALWVGSLLDPWTGAFVALLVWVVVTGALHLDGLADLADGCGAAHGDRARLITVMADPHVGSFGVVAIVLQLLAKLVLLHALSSSAVWSLLPIAAVARAGPLVWARQLPPLKPGLGAAVAAAVRPRDIARWSAVGIALAVWQPFLVAAPLLMLGWQAWLRRKVGGINGDGHGAGIELMETGLLAAALVAGRL